MGTVYRKGIMSPSSAAVDLVARWEGFEPHAYRCPAGVWTLGYGTTRGVVEGMSITEPEARSLLSRDLDGAGRAVERLTPRILQQHQFDALCSFVYNLGQGAYLGSRLRRRILQDRFRAAAAEFLRWRFAGGRELYGLLRRRLEEQSMFMGVSR